MDAPDLPEAARCLGCKYSLRGLPQPICPECGRAFDAADAKTYWLPRSFVYWRNWARPPSAWSIVPLVILTIAELNETSMPFPRPFFAHEARFFPCCSAWLLPIAVCVDYFVRFAAIVIVRTRLPNDGGMKSRRRWRWYLFPACALLVVSAIVTHWPLHARFALSRPYFERAAEQARAKAPSIAGPRWIGLYWVEQFGVNRSDSRIVFFAIRDGVWFEDGIFTAPWGKEGFVSSPDDIPGFGSDQIADRWLLGSFDDDAFAKPASPRPASQP